MSKTNLNFEFDVRIPDALVQQMMDGEITCAMLTAMTILYKWANWGTGVVRFCSARGLVTASHKAYSERTFQVCLQKLEAMGWITRHMVPGSHKDYAVTLHNYKVVDDAGKVQIINPRKLKVSDPTKVGRCAEASDQTSEEASDEGSEETSDKVLPNHLPNLLPQREPDPEPDNDVSFLPSVSQGTGVPQPEEQDKDKPEEPKTGSGSEKQRQEREKVEALIQELGNNTVIPARLGLPYFFGEHDPQLRRIATTLVYRNRSVEWLTSLVRWAKGGDSKDRESLFWKGKLQTGTAAVEKLAGFLETGALAEQFDAMLVATKGSDVFDALRENPWLLRTYPHLAPQPAEKDYGKPLCAGGNLIGYMAKEEPEPGSMEEFMALNRAKAGAGFEPEEAE